MNGHQAIRWCDFQVVGSRAMFGLQEIILGLKFWAGLDRMPHEVDRTHSWKRLQILNTPRVLEIWSLKSP